MLHRRGRAGRAAGLVAAALAAVVIVSGQAFAGNGAVIAPNVVVTPPPPVVTDDDRVIEQRLRLLLQPTLAIAEDFEVQSLIRNLVAQQFDGDTNVLFSTVVAEAEGYLIDPYDPNWMELKDALTGFSNINGWDYEPQIYIPNFDEGVSISENVITAVAPADETVTSTTGYMLDYYGNFVQYPTPIDESFAAVNEVWVLSVNEPIPGPVQPIPLAAAESQAAGSTATWSKTVQPKAAGPIAASEPVAEQSMGTMAVCNPTGLRNDKGLEYLRRWRVPNRNSFGGLFEGKREMKLIIVNQSGAVIKTIYFPKVKKRHIDDWQYADMFITTWDRAVWGDVWGYQWAEIDGGPEISFTAGFKMKNGLTFGATIKWPVRDDDGGTAVVMFSESTYLEYTTGLVNFNPCSVGGDGGTGNDNLACGAVASAESTFYGYSPARVSDCNPDTRLGGAYSWANTGYAPNNPQWVQVDFGVNRTFGRVVVYTSQGYPIQDFDVQVWNGVSFVTVSSVRGNTSLSRTITFSPRTSRLVRINGISGPDHQTTYVRVNELEVYAS